HSEPQAGDVTDDLTARRQRSRGDGLARDPQEQVELLYKESERHDGDRSAHPGQERPLIRRVVAVPLDHDRAYPSGSDTLDRDPRDLAEALVVGDRAASPRSSIRHDRAYRRGRPPLWRSASRGSVI